MSSSVAGSNPGSLSSAAPITPAARSSGRTATSEPLPARPIGVRAVETITASVISEPQIASDEFLHDLVRPRPDLADPGILPGPGDPVLVHVAVAAPELDTRVEHVVLHLG